MDVKKDKGYAWIVVAASAVVMFIGPSAYSLTGIFYSKEQITESELKWVCNSIYVIWFLTALFAGPLSSLYTHRRVVMVGCFIAASGLAVTAISIEIPSLSFFTFSTLVGVGLGLASHATFLLVNSHFRLRRGIATGIGLFSSGIGQALFPILCGSVTESKYIFYISAFMTAFAFLSASLYISPRVSNTRKPQQAIRTPQSINSNVSQLSVPVAEVNGAFPSQCIKSSTCNRGARPNLKKPQLFADVSANMLPNISEESEHSPCLPRESYKQVRHSEPIVNERRLTPRVKVVDIKLANKFSIKPIDAELEKRILKTINTASGSEFNTRPTHSDNVLNKYSASPTSSTQKLLKPIIQIAPLSPILTSRISDLGQGHDSRLSYNMSLTSINETKPTSTLTSPSAGVSSRSARPAGNRNFSNSKERRNETTIPIWRKLFQRIDFTFLLNFRFLNLCVPSVLCMVFMPSFPIVYSSYFTSVQMKAFREQKVNDSTSESFFESEVSLFSSSSAGLTIMFGMDVTTRLCMSFISDKPFYNRRVGFFISSIVATAVCLVIGHIEDTLALKLLGAGFGISFGTMMVTEYLLLIEAFGIKKLTSCYGLINVIRVVIALLLSPTSFPVSTNGYQFYTFKSIQILNDTVSKYGFDPLGLSLSSDNPKSTLINSQQWLRIISIPGILLAILWTLELIRDRRRDGTWRFQAYDRRLQSHQPPKVLLRARSNSNPLL